MKKIQKHGTFDNKLDRDFNQTAPLAVFCLEIAYIPFNHRFAGLSAVKGAAAGEAGPHAHIAIYYNKIGIKNN